jgi:hypothetical protein
MSLRAPACRQCVKHGGGKSCENLTALALQLFEGRQYHFNIFSEAGKLGSQPDLASRAFATTVSLHPFRQAGGKLWIPK